MPRANSFIVFCLVLASCHHASPVKNEPPVVSTDAGLISGTTSRSEDVRIFRGIPFAAPPVGALRWREPQPVAHWKGVRPCDRFGSGPAQIDPGGPKSDYSEDCLYLNVWTAARQPAEKRPVLVWIYGGGFTNGTSSFPGFDGEALAGKGVVFVSFNYRVGIFGTLAHPALSRESPHRVSGNYDILDQIAALQWVQRNIAAFGGDPSNVTIDGQSAGSCSVNTLIASPLARGLFRRAIAESGAFFRPHLNKTLAQAEQEGRATMDGKKATTLEAMRALSPGDLMASDERRLPVVDGYVLPASIDSLFAEGRINSVDLLTGYNEGDHFLDSTLTSAGFIAFARRNFGERSPDFLLRYPAGSEVQAAQSQNALSRDLRFGWEHYTWAKAQSRRGGKVYMYYFSRVPPGVPNLGAYHFAEVEYALHTLAKDHYRPWTSWDKALSEAMCTYWVNFASTGDPNGKDMPVWPLFSADHTRVMQFGDSIRITSLPAQPAFVFFEPYPF
jgi:para-nitrobenzyl esterase